MFTDRARPDDSRSRSGMPCVAGAVGIVPGSRAFDAAIAIVHETMGQAKIEVFRRSLARRRRFSARTGRSRAPTPICPPQTG